MKSMVQLLAHVTLMGMISLLNILFLLFTFQRSLYFFESRNMEKPKNIRVGLVSADGNEVDVYLLDRGSTRDLVYMSGNAVFVREHFDLCMFLFSTFDCNVISMIYRGLDGNAGVPSERGIVEDIKTLAGYLDGRTVLTREMKARRTRKVVFGFSIGAGAAIHLANMCSSVDSLVLLNPFMSLPLAAGERSVLIRPIRFLIVDRWDNAENIEKIELPVLFIVSGDDELVPPHHSNSLIRGTRSYEKYVIPYAGHNTPLSNETLFRTCVQPVISKALERIQDDHNRWEGYSPSGDRHAPGGDSETQ